LKIVIVRKGYYNCSTINWGEFEIKKFAPFLFDTLIYRDISCGASLLATLTGDNPYKIQKLNKNNTSTPDNFILSYLKKKNFKVKEITQALITKNTSNFILNRIKDNHLIMSSNLIKKNEATWNLMVFGKLYHGFDCVNINYLETINHPLISCYIITHKKYQ
jgi:hypothetical protein